MNEIPRSKKEIGVFCSYVPLEIIESAGFRPRMITGLEAGEPDTFIPVNVCSYIRRCASFLNSPGADNLAGIVLTDSCYPMMRLYDFVRRRTATANTWLLRVPRLLSAESYSFFRKELDALAENLLAASGMAGSDRLKQAIGIYNRSRRLNARLTSLMMEGRPGLAGRLSSIHSAAYHIPREDFNGELEACLAEYMGEKDAKPGGRPRILIAGSFFIHTDLIELLEEMGALVVALDSCSHDRLGTSTIPGGDKDPMDSLAAGYLEKPACPRMRSSREHIHRMRLLARKGLFDGVIYILMKFCTPHAYNVPVWKKTLEEAGVPMMLLETEDGRWDSPRVVTRLEAYMESLREKIHVR